MNAKLFLEKGAKKHAQPRKFRFVDQNDRSQEAATAYQSIVRSHVMTEIRREKRSKFKINQRDGGTQSLIDVQSAEAFEKTLERTNQRHSTSPNYSSRQDLTNDLSHILQENFRSTENWIPQSNASDEWGSTTAVGDRIEAFYHLSRLQEIGSPTILGKSRIDPFHVLPVPADREVYLLVDHYTVTIPQLMYGTRTRNPVQHRLYHVASQDTAAFHAMLAYAARQLDSMGATHISKRALGHSSQTLRLVRDRIKEPAFECEDGLVMAVALLAFAERRFGDEMIARQHWLALGQILKVRGGMETLRIDRWLAATLYWNCLVWSGTLDRSMETSVDWPSIIATHDVLTESSAAMELSTFIADLASSKSRLLSHVRSGCQTGCMYSCSRRKGVFSSSSPLHKLVHPATENKDGQQAAANSQRTSRICQLPCLLYLNIVTLEYEGMPTMLEQYLGKLMICIYDESLDMDVSAEHLLIQLLIGLEDSRAESTRRSHQTIRLASAIWRLGIEARYRIHNALLETLIYPETDVDLPGDVL